MSGETIFMTTGKPMSVAIFEASAADLATRSLGTGMPYASHTSLPSGAVRLVRLSAFTRSSILRTASLEFDIVFLLDVYFLIGRQRAPGIGTVISRRTSIEVPDGRKRRVRARCGTLMRPPVG